MIKREREELGWTRQRLGAEIGVSHATIHNWETGQVREIATGHCVALAEKLPKLTLYMLLTDKQKKLLDKGALAADPVLAIGEPRSRVVYGANEEHLTDPARALAAMYDELPEDDPAKQRAMNIIRDAHQARYPSVWRLAEQLRSEVARRPRAKK